MKATKKTIISLDIDADDFDFLLYVFESIDRGVKMSLMDCSRFKTLHTEINRCNAEM